MTATTKGLDKLRARIVALKADRDATAQLAPSREETRERAGRQLQALAAQGGHWVALNLRRIANGTGTAAELFALPQGATVGPLLVALLGPECLLAGLGSYIDAMPEGTPSAEKAARLKALDAELFAAEVDEEHLVCDLEAAGLEVERRADADPRAVLWLPDAAEAST